MPAPMMMKSNFIMVSRLRACQIEITQFFNTGTVKVCDFESILKKQDDLLFYGNGVVIVGSLAA